jgi:hypothetical protein
VHIVPDAPWSSNGDYEALRVRPFTTESIVS